jgi:hypothetical protein
MLCMRARDNGQLERLAKGKKWNVVWNCCHDVEFLK